MRYALIALLCLPAVAGAQVIRWTPTVTLERPRPLEPEVAPMPREVPPPPTVTLERESANSLYQREVLDRYALPVTVYDVLGRYGLAGGPVPEVPPVPPAPAPKADRPPAPDVPEGAVEYRSARFTQSIATTSNAPSIHPVSIVNMPDVRWRQSGGMLGLTGWQSRKFRTLPAGKAPREYVGRLGVVNSFGSTQYELGLWREYPVGTRFDDVLYNTSTGKVFEHRVKEKTGPGQWTYQVLDRDESQYPPGYAGLKATCQSCHHRPGGGGYAVGLVPGSDQTFSDPLPWGLWNPRMVKFDR